MSGKYIIGIDPDSKKHGMALYAFGELVRLESMRLVDVMQMIEADFNREEMNLIEVHIEDVNRVSAAFGARDKKRDNIHIRLKMAQHIGQCKQAQLEVERLFEFYQIPVFKHKLSKKWKNAQSGKAEFERLTGWSGRSNEDTRSAAYFGFLGCK